MNREHLMILVQLNFVLNAQQRSHGSENTFHLYLQKTHKNNWKKFWSVKDTSFPPHIGLMVNKRE